MTTEGSAMTDTDEAIAYSNEQNAVQRASFVAIMEPADVDYADEVMRSGLIPVNDAHLPCGHDARWKLNGDLLPQWLVAFTSGLHLLGPEAGYPQLCRSWSVADWGQLLREHPEHLVVDDTNWPTTASIGVWEELHASFAEACVDMAIWVEGRDSFSLEAWGLFISDDLPAPEIERISAVLAAAQQQNNAKGTIDYEHGYGWSYT